jgi:hypothetical protein
MSEGDLISPLLLALRRVEVHLFYNFIMSIPMVIALYYPMFPSPVEEAQKQCGCAGQNKAPP